MRTRPSTLVVLLLGLTTAVVVGRHRLLEQTYQAAVEPFMTTPAKTSASLTISTLHYDPIALRNIELAFTFSESRIAVQRLTFDA